MRLVAELESDEWDRVVAGEPLVGAVVDVELRQRGGLLAVHHEAVCFAPLSPIVAHGVEGCEGGPCMKVWTRPLPDRKEVEHDEGHDDAG